MCSPASGNPRVVRGTYTLKDMDDATLRVLRTRRDIACVLVNPLQALHPNASARGRRHAGSASSAGHISIETRTPRGCGSCARCAQHARSR